MLVLSRKDGEKVLILIPGTEIEIEVAVLDHSPHRVRLGFTAPSEVKILRSEVLERINAGPAGQSPVEVAE
jgi:carbon storage regulator CsrA